MKAFISWQDYYSVGDAAIDAQHQQILGYINEMYDAMQSKSDYPLVGPFLDRMVQYTMTHFQDEEKCMLAHNYPDFPQHKALHDQMRRKTAVLRENANLMTGRDVLVFLKDWWTNHILQEDKKYAPYLKTLVEV